MLAAVRWGLSFVLVLVVSIPINGLLISATWGWFITPITGTREISIAEGVGLAMFCSIIGTTATAHLKKWDFAEDGGDWRAMAAKLLAAMVGIGVIAPLVTLAVAGAWHNFFM
ncbi:MAG: hypothetical protein WDN25_21065 [Acetobacteraceae bacterium]